MRILGHVSLPEPLRRGPVRWEPRLRLNRCKYSHKYPFRTPTALYNPNFPTDSGFCERFGSVGQHRYSSYGPGPTEPRVQRKRVIEHKPRSLTFNQSPPGRFRVLDSEHCKISSLCSMLHHFFRCFFCMRVGPIDEKQKRLASSKRSRLPEVTRFTTRRIFVLCFFVQFDSEV